MAHRLGPQSMRPTFIAMPIWWAPSFASTGCSGGGVIAVCHGALVHSEANTAGITPPSNLEISLDRQPYREADSFENESRQRRAGQGRTQSTIPTASYQRSCNTMSTLYPPPNHRPLGPTPEPCPLLRLALSSRDSFDFIGGSLA
jgi:hypothetical protein